MKNKLIASIVTLTVVGGAVTPTFATTKEASLEKTNKWYTIIIGGTVDKPNHNGNTNNNDNNNNNSVIPPTEDTETPNVPDNPSIDETPGDTVVPPTGDTETPSTPDEPTVDETPSVPEQMPSVPEEKPSTPDIPVVDETPDNSTEDNSTNADTNFMAAVETAIYNKVN